MKIYCILEFINVYYCFLNKHLKNMLSIIKKSVVMIKDVLTMKILIVSLTTNYDLILIIIKQIQ